MENRKFSRVVWIRTRMVERFLPLTALEKDLIYVLSTRSFTNLYLISFHCKYHYVSPR